MTQPKTILITGASRGIGCYTTKTLAARGHTVFAGMRNLNGRNAEVAKELTAYAQQCAGDIHPVELDVTQASACEGVVQAIEKGHKLDVLINNAGVMPVGISEGFTLEQAQEVFDVNLYGIMRMNKAALPAMRARRSGLIISLSSSAGRFGMPFFGLYCASKWAMEAYCEALHFELESLGIESLLIEPSGHGTDLVTTAPAPADAACTASYGGLAGGRMRLLNMFQDMFAQGEAITDAQNVADKIADLIEMQTPRPIRTQVGHDMGVSAVNEAVAPIQSALIEQLKPIYTGSAA